MTLKLIRYDETPAGGWRYKDPETGTWIAQPKFNVVTWDDLKREVRKHRKTNNLPIQLGLDDAIEQQLCEILPPEYCRGNSPHTSDPAHPITFAEAMQGTAVMADWWRHGKQRVDPKEAESRAITCMRCHFNQPVSGCASCSMGKIRELFSEIVSSYTIPHDHALHICSKCGCALQGKVRMHLDLLQRHISDSQNSRLPEWCWLKRV